VTEKTKIQNKFGLHLRAAARLAALAARFPCAIRLQYHGTTVDAKSILGLLALGVGNGAELEISAEGGEAEKALRALQALIESKFGEPA
jgi:phosphotransferase system HPr (HPr) family protein